MDQLIIFAAEYLIILPALVVVWLILWRLKKHRDWRFVTFVVLGGLMSLALAKVSGQIIAHPPPFAANDFEPLIEQQIDNSFPSDHTLLAVFLAFAALKAKPKVGWALLILATAIGLARIAVGVHYWQDVLASFVFAGIGALAAGWLVNKYYETKKSSESAKPQRQ